MKKISLIFLCLASFITIQCMEQRVELPAELVVQMQRARSVEDNTPVLNRLLELFGSAITILENRVPLSVTLKSMVERKAQEELQRTVLIPAAKHNQELDVRHCLTLNVSAECQDDMPDGNSNSPLMYAIINGNTALGLSIIRAAQGHAPRLIQQVNALNQTPFMLACKQADQQMAQEIIRIWPYDKHFDKEGCSGLIYAARNKDFLVWLLQNRQYEQNLYQAHADPQIAAGFAKNVTALMLAAKNGCPAAMEKYVGNYSYRNDSLSARDAQGWYTEHYAARYGKKEALEWLRERRVEFTQQSLDRQTALMLACQYGHVDAACYLIRTISPWIITISDKRDWTALMYAVDANKPDIVRPFFGRWYDHDLVDKRNNMGETALSIACAKGFTECIDLLLSNYANAFIEDNKGLNCLMKAAQRGDLAVIKLLVTHPTMSKYLALINARSGQTKVTALQLAAKYGHLAVVTFLVSQGATDVSAALADAQLAGKKPVVEYLKTCQGGLLSSVCSLWS